MTRLILLLGLFCLPLSAYAHQPDISSTILAEKEEGQWVLQIRAALTAFDYEVEARFGKSAYATPEEFREIVLGYLREELLVRFNGNKVAELKDGAVQLGHETTVTFQLTDVPADVNAVTVSNHGFSHIRNNQSALYVAKEGFKRKQFMLNADNGHSAALTASEESFVLDTSSELVGYLLPILLLAAVSLLGMLAYLTYTRKQSFNLTTA